MADLLLVPDAAWHEAQRRAEVIRPLAARGRGLRHLVQAAAASLALSERQTYTLLRRCREADGALTALLPGHSGGGRGRTRLDAGSEALLRRAVEVAWCMDQGCRRINPNSVRGSRYPSITWASEIQHAVERVDGNRHLGRPALVRMRTQLVADHLFPSVHGGFDPGAPVVSRRVLPRHAPVLGDVLDVAVPLC